MSRNWAQVLSSLPFGDESHCKLVTMCAASGRAVRISIPHLGSDCPSDGTENVNIEVR